jgi:hypothetical protein
MTLTLNDWKDLVDIIKNATVSMAVLIGGGWTLYRFHRLRHIANAEAELRAKVADLKVKEMDYISRREALHKSAVLEARISAEQMDVHGAEGLYISAVVSIKNIGNTDTLVKFEENEFVISSAKHNEDGNLIYSIISRAEHPSVFGTNIIGTSIPSGYTCQIPYVFKVDEVGIYLLSFKTNAYGEDNPSLRELGKSASFVSEECSTDLFITAKPLPARKQT